MEFNRGDVFPSIPALFIIFFLIACALAQRGNALRRWGLIGCLGVSGGRRDGDQRDHQELGWVYRPKQLLLSLDLQNIHQGELEILSRAVGWEKGWEQPRDYGKRGKTMPCLSDRLLA